MVVILILAVINLICITIQDFKYRAVYWWLFPSLMLLLSGFIYIKYSVEVLVDNACINTLFIGLQIIFLSIYFMVKKGKWVNIFKGYFGLGDLLLLLSICVYFNLKSFIWFYLISLLIIISISILNRNKHEIKIPLAGYQALFLSFYLVLDLYRLIFLIVF